MPDAPKDYTKLSDTELDAELTVEQGIIDAYKNDVVRNSGKYWGAVANRLKITDELRKRGK